MKKTILILMLMLCAASPVLAEKQGFCKSFKLQSLVFEPNEIEILTVPAYKQFVLSAFSVSCNWMSQWSLSANENFSVSGVTDGVTMYRNRHRGINMLPDRIAIINPSETLTLSFLVWGNDKTLIVTIMGYFEDLPQCPSSDLTGDCKVNFDDFALMASQWLDGT